MHPASLSRCLLRSSTAETVRVDQPAYIERSSSGHVPLATRERNGSSAPYRLWIAARRAYESMRPAKLSRSARVSRSSIPFPRGGSKPYFSFRHRDGSLRSRNSRRNSRRKRFGCH